MEAFAVAIQSVINDSGFLAFTTYNAIMILVGLILLYLAFAREFEPLLLGPIAFGCVLANISLVTALKKALWRLLVLVSLKKSSHL